MKRSFQDIGHEVCELVEQKNLAYGDSFAKCGEFLKLLYPDGISTAQYGNMLCLARIFDKMMRIASWANAFGENPYQDIAGYAILGVSKLSAKTVEEVEFTIGRKAD